MRSHSATHHDPLDVLDDDANDNPEPGAEPRERHALAPDVLSDSAIDSLNHGEGEKAKPKDDKTKEDTAAQAQRVMAQQTRKPRRGTSSRKDDGLKKGGASKATVVISMGGRARGAWAGCRCRGRGGRADVCREV